MDEQTRRQEHAGLHLVAWSWSHTSRAYRNVEVRIYRLPKKKLATIWAEWKVHFVGKDWEAKNALWMDDEGPEPADYDWHEEYEKFLKEARNIIKKKGKADLAEEVWDWAREYATCTNGGWQAYACPDGCGCHLVSFDDLKWYEAQFKKNSGVPEDIQELAANLLETV
jgi:hypothetical protein